jgi:chemotaxis protein histidine kinase CheA
MKSEYKTRDGRKLSELTEEEYRLLDDKDVVRVISEIELVEISVVNVPANPSSLFSLTKAVRAYFDKMETRSVMDLQRRILISNDSNPFIDTPKQEEIIEEEKQEEQEETTEEVTEPTESEAIGDTTPEHVVETQADTTEETEEEGEEVVEVTTTEEAPQEQEQKAQTEATEVEQALEEERRLNQELLEQLERATSLVENLQNKINTRAVNKPVLYSQNQVKDQFAEQLLKAKTGH